MNSTLFNLAGKTALVTGSSRGLGQAMAIGLAEAGAFVGITSRSMSSLQETSDVISASAGQFEKLVFDVSSPSEAKAKIRAFSEKHNGIDILINNAGITQDNILMRMKDDEWNNVIDTNLNALFRLTKACVRGMTKARWGRVVNVTSVVGSMGNPGQSNYAATKAGAEGMARSLAKELGSRSITVNCVAPGFIDTDMTKALDEAQRHALAAQIPLSRLGEPSDIAAVVAFLVSDAAQYITGETIHVNGGLYMG